MLCVLLVACGLVSTVQAEPMVGPSVGNADLLVAEGNKLYNEKKFDKARDNFLKATRVAPQTLPTYLSLARAYLALSQVELACPSYKAFIKNATDTQDRQKAQGELELCERQLKARLPGGSPLTQKAVTLKAALFDALDKGAVLGAGEQLKALVDAQYAAPDLGDMAAKVSGAAFSRAEALRTASVAHQKVLAEDLRKAAALYNLSLDAGALPAQQLARAAFMEGMALLVEGKAFQAEVQFADAAKRDVSDAEAKFYRGFAVFKTGDKQGAVQALEKELPNDPRTGILKVAMAFDRSPVAVALEFEKFLFARRFKTTP
jgi:tetratricopeptide (TPR) repeat protein